jgi:glutamine synthetase
VIDLGDVRERFREHKVKRVKLAAIDVDGTLRGKWISMEKFASIAESTVGFCDVVFGWDIGDVLYDNVKYTGWHTGYPDATCRVDLETYRAIPWEPGTAMFLLDFIGKDAQPLGIAPRQVFQRVLGRAEDMGYSPSFAAEYEFFMFRETAQTLREKQFADLTPLTPGMFGYSVLRASANSELLVEMLAQLEAFDIPLEALHTETGPGVFEAAIAVAEGIRAADRASLFKTAVKEIAGRHGLIPTFMAKWNTALPGSSGHLHQSLWDIMRNGNLFTANDAGQMPPLMQQYIAGLVAHLPELTACFCPTVNSYKRTVPGVWAPVNATWGMDNRTTAVRAIPSTGTSSRVELRATGADINPYIAMAASLAEATRQFRESEMARRWLGEDFVEHYAATREWEVRQFEKAVTDWELARYLEAI